MRSHSPPFFGPLSYCSQRRFQAPRPITWLPRLPEIRRSVKRSARSHCERKDIERLFELQPRAAQALVQGISPSAQVGRSFLLARADLEARCFRNWKGRNSRAAAPGSLPPLLRHNTEHF
jgi:hypothetical protein